MTRDVSAFPAEWHAEVRRLGGVSSMLPEASVLTVTFDDENGADAPARPQPLPGEGRSRRARQSGAPDGLLPELRAAGRGPRRADNAMSAPGTAGSAALVGEREIAFTRKFNAPREPAD